MSVFAGISRQPAVAFAEVAVPVAAAEGVALGAAAEIVLGGGPVVVD